MRTRVAYEDRNCFDQFGDYDESVVEYHLSDYMSFTEACKYCILLEADGYYNVRIF